MRTGGIRDGPEEKEERLRPASETPATSRKTGTDQPACLNLNAAYRSAQYSETQRQVISSCKARRKQTQARPRRRVEDTPLPDCSPATPGRILADTGWVTVDRFNARLFIVAGNNGEATRRWAERVLRDAQDDKPNDHDDDRPATPSGVREPRKPITPFKTTGAEAQADKQPRELVEV